jgi:hypothetical protein
MRWRRVSEYQMTNLVSITNKLLGNFKKLLKFFRHGWRIEQGLVTDGVE